MSYKHQELDPAPILRELGEPNFLIKIIPHVDGKARICELVRYRWRDGALKGAWGGPVALQLFAHAMGNVSKLPVLEVLSGTHFVADVTLGLGEVVHDYLAAGQEAPVRSLSRAMNEMRPPRAKARGDSEPKTIFGRRTVPTSPENTRVDYELLIAGRA